LPKESVDKKRTPGEEHPLKVVECRQ
jgi:hypothetical protein